jgi:hypothetical protein
VKDQVAGLAATPTGNRLHLDAQKDQDEPNE